MVAVALPIRRRAPVLSTILAALSTLLAFRQVFVIPTRTLQSSLPVRSRADRALLVPRGARGGEEALAVGDAVEAVFEEDGNWYSAVVEKVNKDGTFEVKWDDPGDGPETGKVTAENIKKYSPPIPLDELQIGAKYKGTIVSTTGFGAFINIGAEKEGLCHISCIKDGFVSNVDDEVSPGQQVDVWVKGIENGKLSLSMVESKLGRGGGGGGRREKPDLTPFQSISWGEKLKGRVVSVQNFGAFVEVTAPNGPTAQGLVHVSQLSDGYVEDPNQIVSVGQEVEVMVKDVDIGAGRLSLTMKSE